MVGEEVGELDTLGDHRAGDLKLGHAFHYGEESGLVDLAEGLAGLVAEEDLGGLNCHLVVLGRVYHSGDLLGETLLEGTEAGILGLLLYESLDLLTGERGEDLDVLLGIGVGNVEPELVELVGGGVAGIEPYVSALGLAELTGDGLGDEGGGEGVGLET